MAIRDKLNIQRKKIINSSSICKSLMNVTNLPLQRFGY